MPSMLSLIQKLRLDYPSIRIEKGDDFHWSFKDSCVTYSDDGIKGSTAHLLHEMSHAIVGHKDYKRDIELLSLERDAWDYAKEILSPKYKQPISDEIIKASMDSYRDWLHARSTCPNCSATGIEIKQSIYSCPVCVGRWTVNQARLCGLRRQPI